MWRRYLPVPGTLTPAWTTCSASTFVWGGKSMNISGLTHHLPTSTPSWSHSPGSSATVSVMVTPATASYQISSLSHFYSSAALGNTDAGGGGGAFDWPAFVFSTFNFLSAHKHYAPPMHHSLTSSGQTSPSSCLMIIKFCQRRFQRARPLWPQPIMCCPTPPPMSLIPALLRSLVDHTPL